ncbi:MAG: FCD domain-containing protein, partial [Steroidobacteraceae bacterium]
IHYLLRVYRYKFSANPEPRARALQLFQEHKEIVAAIARRDSIAAEHKMRQHIQSGAAYELRREARMAQHTPNTKSSIPRNVERAKQRARP